MKHRRKAADQGGRQPILKGSHTYLISKGRAASDPYLSVARMRRAMTFAQRTSSNDIKHVHEDDDENDEPCTKMSTLITPKGGDE